LKDLGDRVLRKSDQVSAKNIGHSIQLHLLPRKLARQGEMIELSSSNLDAVMDCDVL
jgi:hypothetical protein